MDYKNILRALLVNAYKLPETEIDSLLNESANEAETQTALLGIDSNRVNKIKEPLIGKFDQGRAAERKELMTNLEKSLKEKFGFESDAQGVELIEAIVNAKTETSKNSKTLTDDDVKKHPVYQGLEKAKRDELKAKQTEMEKTVADLQNGFKKKETFSEVSKKALTILDELKPILPTNPAAAQTQKDMFLKTFEAYDFEFQDGRILPLKDGKVVEDGHGNTTDFDTIVKTTASSWFDFQQNNGGSNGGNGNAGSGKHGENGGGTPPKFKTYEEIARYSQDTTIPIEQRQKALVDWEATQKNGS